MPVKKIFTVLISLLVLTLMACPLRTKVALQEYDSKTKLRFDKTFAGTWKGVLYDATDPQKDAKIHACELIINLQDKERLAKITRKNLVTGAVDSATAWLVKMNDVPIWNIRRENKAEKEPYVFALAARNDNGSWSLKFIENEPVENELKKKANYTCEDLMALFHQKQGDSKQFRTSEDYMIREMVKAE